MTEPATRSNVERTFFGLLSELPAEMQRDLAERTDPTDYETARKAPLLGWTPLSHAVGLRESLRQLVGDDDRFVDLIHEWAVLSVNRPPFKILTEAVLRIYARRPGSLLRAYARVWGTVYRGVGDYGVEHEDDNAARSFIRDACPAALEPAFRLYTLGVLRGVMEIGGARNPRGTQRVVERRIEFELAWD